jgi:hypothetical protein
MERKKVSLMAEEYREWRVELQGIFQRCVQGYEGKY